MHLTFRVTTVLNMISYHPNVSLMIQKQTAETAVAISTFLSQSFGKSIIIFTFSPKIQKYDHKNSSAQIMDICMSRNMLSLDTSNNHLDDTETGLQQSINIMTAVGKSFSFLFVLFQNVLFFRNKIV